MSIITSTAGYFIIGSSAVELDGNVLSYRDDAPIQEFDSKREMNMAHITQFPDQYKYSKGIDEVDQEPYLHHSDEL